MFETYRMLGREREVELVREAERVQRKARTRPGSWKRPFSIAGGVGLALLRRRSVPALRSERLFDEHGSA
jgi:hypothetical protein